MEDAAELVKGNSDVAKRIIPVIIGTNHPYFCILCLSVSKKIASKRAYLAVFAPPDVTKPEEIASCVEEVKKTLEKTGSKLHALVNNAGITCNLPTEVSTVVSAPGSSQPV